MKECTIFGVLPDLMYVGENDVVRAQSLCLDNIAEFSLHLRVRGECGPWEVFVLPTGEFVYIDNNYWGVGRLPIFQSTLFVESVRDKFLDNLYDDEEQEEEEEEEGIEEEEEDE